MKLKRGSLLLVWCAGVCATVPTTARPETAEVGKTAPAPTPANASGDITDLSLQELMAVKIEQVSTPSRFTQKISEAPASVSVVTSEEISLFGYRTLADVLRSVRGLYVTYDRSYSYLGVRGFSRPSDYNSRVLVLVDGHRMNENLFGGVLIGQEFILDVDLIDRVEVVRGPTSSLYGGGAFFGVANVITKKAKAIQPVELSFDVGSRESYHGRFSCAGTLTNTEVQFVLSGSIYESTGNRQLYFPEFDDPATNNGLAENLDHEQAWNLFGSLIWKDFTLTTAYVSRLKDIPTASWDTLFNDPRYNTVDNRGYVDLKWQHALDEDNDLMARAYFDDYRYTADYPSVPPQPDGSDLTRDSDLGQRVGGELQWTRRWRQHVFIAGTEVYENFTQSQSYTDVSPPYNVYLDDDRSSTVAAFYLQGEFTLCSNLRLDAGVRYDHYSTFGSTTNPRLGLIYNPWAKSAFKLLYGTAFRAPNVFEMFYEGLGSAGNPDLNPEKIQTYELVYEQELPAHLFLSQSVYYYNIDNLIYQVGDGTPNAPYQFQNVGQAQAVGSETELEWRNPSGIRARASYAWQQTRDSDTWEILVNSPEHLAKLNVIVPLWPDKVFAGIEVQYTSSVQTLAGQQTEDFWLLNTTLFSQRLIKGVEMSASLYNLLDAHYAFPGGPGHVQDQLWQDGRSFRVKLTYRF